MAFYCGGGAVWLWPVSGEYGASCVAEEFFKGVLIYKNLILLRRDNSAPPCLYIVKGG